MSSSVVKRIIAGAVGLLYSVVYGFWTMLITGGGHGNFIWMILFFVSYFFGLFFPIMAALAVDLRPIFAKAVSAVFLFISLIANILIFMPIILGQPGDSTTDFQKSWNRDPTGTVFFAAVHFLPLIIFSFFLFRSMFLRQEIIDGEEFTGLGLN